MNISVAINSPLSTMGLKDQLSKQAGHKQNQSYGDHLEGYWLGGGRGSMGGKVQGLTSTNA